MIRRLLLYQVASSLVAVAALFIIGTTQQGWSGVFGAAVMTANSAVLAWSWRRIFLKKSIALAVSVIVFKYAILGIVIYFALKSDQIDYLGLAIGLLTVVPSVLLLALGSKTLPHTNS